MVYFAWEEQGSRPLLGKLVHIASFPEWTMDGLIWQGLRESTHVALGLSNNSLAVFQHPPGTPQVAKESMPNITDAGSVQEAKPALRLSSICLWQPASASLG